MSTRKTNAQKSAPHAKIDSSMYLDEDAMMKAITSHMSFIVANKGLMFRIPADIVLNDIRAVSVSIYGDASKKQELRPLPHDVAPGSDKDPLMSLNRESYSKATTFCTGQTRDIVPFANNNTKGKPVEDVYFGFWINTRIMALVIAYTSYWIKLFSMDELRKAYIATGVMPPVDSVFPATDVTIHVGMRTILKDAITCADGSPRDWKEFANIASDMKIGKSALYATLITKSLGRAYDQNTKWNDYTTPNEERAPKIPFSVKHGCFIPAKECIGSMPNLCLIAKTGAELASIKSYSCAVIHDDEGKPSMAAPTIAVVAQACNQVINLTLFLSADATPSLTFQLSKCIVTKPYVPYTGMELTGKVGFYPGDTTPAQKAEVTGTTTTTSAASGTPKKDSIATELTLDDLNTV